MCIYMAEVVVYPTRPIRAALKQVSPSAMNGCNIIPTDKKPNWVASKVFTPG